MEYDRDVRITGIADLTAWVQGLGKGLMPEPDFDREILTTGACAGIDCRTCGLCMDLEGK